MSISLLRLLPFKIFMLGFNLTRKYFHFMRYFFDLIISLFLYKTKIIILQNNTSLKPKENLCVFSHYDPDNIIDPYVIYYLQALARYCDIIFVTTCETLLPEEIQKINHLCKKIIIKTNRGLDFSSYKHGLNSEKNLMQYQRILLVNDSVYGPFFDLDKIIHYGDNHLDMWGATDSYMINYHIQSYFVVFSRSIFLTHAFSKFWNKIHNLKLKNNIIIRYEIGMSQFFLHHHFKLGAFSKHSPVMGNKSNIDPSHHHWKQIIIEHKHPFIKRMLIRNNPHNIPLANWQSFIASITHYDIYLIKHHLARTT